MRHSTPISGLKPLPGLQERSAVPRTAAAMKKLLWCTCLLFLPSISPVALAVPVVVGATDASEGNRFPWGIDGSMRWQQVFSASELTGFVGQTLDQIAYRSSQGPLGYNISSLIISVSTSTNAPGSLSSTFADNVGSDNTVVFNQTNITVGANSSSGGFDFALPFTTPFLYTGGNLLIDVLAGDSSGGVSTYFLANFDGSPLTQRIFSQEGSPVGVSGTVGNRGTFATQLNFSGGPAAPEVHPGTATLPLTFVAFSCMVFSRRRRYSY
jgi:hypothetical protein